MDKEKIIAEAKAANACIEGIEAFRKWEGDNDSFMQEYPGFGWWAVGNCPSFKVSAERLDKCAEAKPVFALRYSAKHLTPERLDKCAEAEPAVALRYAAEHLTPERLDKCAEADPVFALKHAAKRPSPERKAWCMKQ